MFLHRLRAGLLERITMTEEINWDELIEEKARRARPIFSVRMSKKDRERLKKLCKACDLKTADMLSLLIKKGMIDLKDKVEEWEAKQEGTPC